MLLLALDTALAACSACLFDTDSGAVRHELVIPMDKGHAEALMPLIDRLLLEANVEATSLDRLVTSVGPGSFTGLRVGISAARGMAFAIGCDCVGVSTLAALAAPLITVSPDSTVACAIDARHGHVFFAVFGPGGRALIKPALVSLEEAATLGARFGATTITGNATALLALHWPKDRDAPSLAPASHPPVEWIARLGALATPEEAPPAPLYLRAPDAKVPASAALERSSVG
jgi:tRNA threonylcarbamoyl adenosine modification protein YeaZ